jgi:hypothetical protein
MKKILLSAALAFIGAAAFAQDRTALVKAIAEPLMKNTTRVVLYDEPESYVLHQPTMRQDDAELISIRSGEKMVNFSLREIRDVSLEHYGVVVSNRDRELTFYMDLKHNARLREQLQQAFENYLRERDTKRYTVRE